MKMEMPKMDVVRFQEADVIVASGTPVDNNFYTTLGAWGGTSKNATIKISQGKNVLFDYNWDQLNSAEGAKIIDNNKYYSRGDKSVSLADLYADEKLENPLHAAEYEYFNGSYISSDGINYRYQ